LADVPNNTLFCLASTEEHRYVDTQDHFLSLTAPHIHQSSYSRKPEKTGEIGSPALRSRPAKEKLLAAAKVAHTHYLLMEQEWRSRHCTLSGTLSNDSFVFPCIAALTVSGSDRLDFMCAPVYAVCHQIVAGAAVDY